MLKKVDTMADAKMTDKSIPSELGALYQIIKEYQEKVQQKIIEV